MVARLSLAKNDTRIKYNTYGGGSFHSFVGFGHKQTPEIINIVQKIAETKVSHAKSNL